MKCLILLLSIYCIADMPGASAQLSEGSLPLKSEENDFSFLPYRAYQVSTGQDNGSFEPVTLATRPVMLKMPVLFHEDDSKIYRITPAGAYEYSYGNADDIPNSRRGYKPITARTFFLETSRAGLLPEVVSYPDFVRMTPQEQLALLEIGEELKAPVVEKFEYKEAMLSYRTSQEGYQIIVATNDFQFELTYGSRGDDSGLMVGIKYLPHIQTPPQMVKLLLDPWNNYQFSGHAYYKNVNSVFGDLSSKTSQY